MRHLVLVVSGVLALSACGGSDSPTTAASPYEGLPSPVVASAWGLQAEFDSALDPGLAEFVDFYENGPQTPEKGSVVVSEEWKSPGLKDTESEATPTHRSSLAP